MLGKGLLITLDYLPQTGGVAAYLAGLIDVAHGDIEVMVPADHPAAMLPGIKSLPFSLSGRWSWLLLVGYLRRRDPRTASWLLISHVLPLGTAVWLAKICFGATNYVIVLHGLDLKLAQRSVWKRWLLHRILRGSRLIIANSEFVAGEIKTFDAELTVLTLTPAVAPARYPERAIARQERGLRNDQIIILAVGRLVRRKGFDRLIQAMSDLPERVRLVILGDGIDRSRLERMMTKHADQVTLITRFTQRERDGWYAAADLFALPVRQEGEDVEGFGIVFLEAAQAGLPVIAGRSGGAGEAVQDGVTGFLVDPENQHDLVAKIKALIDDPELRRRFGQAGQAWAKNNFRWSDRWEKLQKAIVNIL